MKGLGGLLKNNNVLASAPDPDTAHAYIGFGPPFLVSRFGIYKLNEKGRRVLRMVKELAPGVAR